MKNKYRKLFAAFFYTTLTYANQLHAKKFDVWSESPVGKCYESLDEYLILNFGTEYKNDENIKIINLASLNFNKKKHIKKYFWVMDTTPELNVTRILFKIRKNGEACAILYVPLSSYVSLKLSTQGNLPTLVTSKDSPPPGFLTNKIIYKLNIFNGTYAPVNCIKVNPKGKDIKISCDRAFQD